jgi:hypothetical protein
MYKFRDKNLDVAKELETQSFPGPILFPISAFSAYSKD